MRGRIATPWPWFLDESEIVRMALWELVRRNRIALTEHFQRADIAWALQQSKRAATSSFWLFSRVLAKARAAACSTNRL